MASRANFSLVAPFYRWMELVTFGTALQKRREFFLAEVLTAKNVLILGDGDGRFAFRFLERLTQTGGSVSVDFIDNSPSMIRLARARLDPLTGPTCALRLQLSDVHSAQFRGPYDLVVTHFFLDCFTESELREWVPRVASHTREGARWLISEFAIPKHNPWRFLGRVLVRSMYLFFKLFARLQATRLPEYGAILRQSGFVPVEHNSPLRGLLLSELWTRA